MFSCMSKAFDSLLEEFLGLFTLRIHMIDTGLALSEPKAVPA